MISGVLFLAIILLSLLLLVFENLAASFFWKFFYRKWPERLILEEELDREFHSDIQQLDIPKGDSLNNGLRGKYKIIPNSENMDAPFIFLKLAGSRAFATATIHAEGNVSTLRLRQKRLISQILLPAIFTIMLILSLIPEERSLLLIIMCAAGLTASFPKSKGEAQKLKQFYETFKRRVTTPR
jgi:hypothetical protein